MGLANCHSLYREDEGGGSECRSTKRLAIGVKSHEAENIGIIVGLNAVMSPPLSDYSAQIEL